MAVLSFAATATIGSLKYSSNLAAVRAVSSVGPGVGSARISVPAGLRVDAVPTDAITIAMTGESADEVTVFTGTVRSVSRGLDVTTIEATDGSGALAAIRTGKTFEQQNASATVNALARDAGVDVGSVDLDLDLPTYVAHQGRTAWEHVSTLATWGGCLATAGPDGQIEVRSFPSPPADRALRYGREIAELAVASVPRSPDLVLTGFGPAGNGTDPRARLQTVATIPDSAAGPDANTIRVAAPALRSPNAVNAAIEAAAAHNGVPRLRAACWLVPQLRAGTTVEVADAPDDTAKGPWLITRAVHRIGPGPSGRTDIEAISLQSAGGAGLLGQLAGAIGGLL
jgi:hypothetical protein